MCYSVLKIILNYHYANPSKWVSSGLLILYLFNIHLFLINNQLLFIIVLLASSRSLVRHFGQPAAQTHPHLIQNGEVTPGITKEEFRQRRRNLIHKISTTSYHKSQHSHIVIIPSATKTYMTHDIPYIFR